MAVLRIRMLLVAAALVAPGASGARAQEDTPQSDPAEAPAQEALEKPEAIAPAKLVPNLETVAVRRGTPAFNVQLVDASLLPRDKAGIWVLDFAFKPVRITTIEIPGKGRRQVHYMYYRVINHTGKPQMFVPQFSLVTDTGKRYEDTVLPMAVSKIKAREDPSIRLYGAVDIMGMIPPSTKDGIDDAVYGVAVWEGVDPKADRFHVYVRGLSDGYQLAPPPDGGKAVVRYKTLRIDYVRRGDEHDLTEKEIQLLDPPYEWIYW